MECRRAAVPSRPAEPRDDPTQARAGNPAVTTPFDAHPPTAGASAGQVAFRAEYPALGAWLDASGAPLTAVLRGGAWTDYRLARLERVRMRLARSVPTAEAMAAWWTIPIVALGGATPRDLLSRGAVGPLFVAVRQAEGATRRATSRPSPGRTGGRRGRHQRSDPSGTNTTDPQGSSRSMWPGADDLSEDAWLEH